MGYTTQLYGGFLASPYKDPYHSTSIMEGFWANTTSAHLSSHGSLMYYVVTESVGCGKVEKTDANKKIVGQHLGPKWNECIISQMLHGTGIFTYIYHKFKPNVGNIPVPWMVWFLPRIKVRSRYLKVAASRLGKIIAMSWYLDKWLIELNMSWYVWSGFLNLKFVSDFMGVIFVFLWSLLFARQDYQ